MTTRPKPSAVIFAKDVQRLADFYRQVIGMQQILADDAHIVLDQAGFQLVIHGMPQPIADSITISSPPEVREETPIKICHPVVRIAAARAIAAELGGLIAPVDREWSATGFRACDGYDPEGNVFQVRESVG
jgi:catechol 2,3-dioxygenase-like lactoylglutathione lyase family enzyme